MKITINNIYVINITSYHENNYKQYLCHINITSYHENNYKQYLCHINITSYHENNYKQYLCHQYNLLPWK